MTYQQLNLRRHELDVKEQEGALLTEAEVAEYIHIEQHIEAIDDADFEAR